MPGCASVTAESGLFSRRTMFAWSPFASLIAASYFRVSSHYGIVSQKKPSMGFPGGAVVESLPANAGDTGSRPGLGGSHVPRSNWAREPQLLSLRIWSLCSATREAAIVRGPRTVMKSGPRLPPTRESPRTETKTQHSHK